MLAQRIALLAERLGIPVPRVAGASHLGLSGTIRVTEPVPLVFAGNIGEQLAEIDPGLDQTAFVDGLNSSDVWVWAEVRQGSRWRWPEAGQDPEALVQGSEGHVPPQGFAIVLSTGRWSLRCAPARGGLLVLGVLRPRRAPCARLLVGQFSIGSDPTFDAEGLCTLVASQTRLRVRIDQRQIESEEVEERDFLTTVRRYLEALRNHAVASSPRLPYQLADRTPVRIRTTDGDAWPRAFVRPGTLVQIPADQGDTFAVADVSDDGDTITLDADSETLPEHGDVRVRPSDDSLRRMREALDTIAMGVDEAHGRLLAALTRPESLPELPRAELSDGDEETRRQVEATALALSTPDIALIHGPPGTGKTTVICDVVQDLVRRGQRVLLVAPTHVALDNVLERVGDRQGVTAIRLGSPDNVEEPAQRYLLPNRRGDLSRRLAVELATAVAGVEAGDGVADVQREWAARIAGDADGEVGTLLLLNANLVCATPIGIAMAREFRNVEVLFDVMILDEASKATITDFLVPSARARKWILVGDHRQLAPFVDLDELEAVISERVKRLETFQPPTGWMAELSNRLRQHFDNRMHPDRSRRDRSWSSLVDVLLDPFGVDAPTFERVLGLGADADKWREAHRSITHGTRAGQHTADAPWRPDEARFLRLGAELLEIQNLALPSVFEHLTRLPKSRAVRLNYQHRMVPSLAAFSSELVYEGDYPSAGETHKLGLEIPTLEAPAIWIDTAFAPPGRRFEYPRDQDWSGGDYTNDLEIDVALELVETCAEWAVHSWRGDPRERGRGPAATFEVGVVSFYLRQALRLRDAIFRRLPEGRDPWRRRWRTRAANGAPIELHVSIVDRFQGREKDVTVLCTTRSNPKGTRGHVDNLNRLNVAVTRARHKRIVIGDSTTLAGQEGGKRRHPEDLLRRLYETSERKKKWGRALGGRR